MNKHLIPYSVYAIIDPREPDRYRYVGKTTKTLQARLSNHFTEARATQKPNRIYLSQVLPPERRSSAFGGEVKAE